MAAVLIFNHVYWFWQKTTLGKLVAMATKKHLSLIYELENFANKVSRWWLVSFLSSEQFTGLEVETPPPPPLQYE